MSSIRVMHLNDSLDVGGAEMMILSLLSELKERGFAPSVCGMQSGGTLGPRFAERAIPVAEYAKKSGIDFGMILRLAWRLACDRVEILHTHNYYSWIYGGVACSMVPGCLHLHTQHSHLVLPRPLPPPVRNLLKGLPRHVIAVSEQVHSSLVNQGYLAPGAKVSVIYNGIDVTRYAPCAAGTTFRVGIVARLVEVKNHELLIRAFAELLKSGRKAELVVVGGGPLRSRLEGLCRDLVIESAVRFLGERDDVAAILASLDVFVLPSRSEGLSISILEAMASSLPVVASRVGGNPVLVKDGSTGILFEDNDSAALASSLALLQDNPAMRQSMGKNGRTAVVEKFSLAKMVDNYICVYRQFLPEIKEAS